MSKNNNMLQIESKNDEFLHPYVCADCVIFGYDEQIQELKVLLLLRTQSSYKGHWALPGGFLDYEKDRDADECIRRKLREKCNITKHFTVEQFKTYSDRTRDSIRWSVSIAYFAIVKISDCPVLPGIDTEKTEWFTFEEALNLQLAFDHGDILTEAFEHLQRAVLFKPLGFELLPEYFTMSQLQNLYEKVLGEEFDRRNFRQLLLNSGVIKEVEDMQKNNSDNSSDNEAAIPTGGKIYRFDRDTYDELAYFGVSFQINPLPKHRKKLLINKLKNVH